MKKQKLSVRLIKAEEIVSALPIFSSFYPSLSKKNLQAFLYEMAEQGYQCAIAYYKEQCIGVIGIWIQTKLYVGKHIEYDNFYVLPEYRGKGVGKKLLKFVDRYAKEQNCIAAELTCDIDEEESKDFWENQEFTVIGLRYQRDLR
ncbi:MAG: GNAT family N-acetyltransferase [Helicobacteraceae bacterium]|nr:GNAT family N-acetyltransferase [Helicobacteraceae bacterium]